MELLVVMVSAGPNSCVCLIEPSLHPFLFTSNALLNDNLIFAVVANPMGHGRPRLRCGPIG